jgi:single-strand DNA-binding protein
MIIATVTGNLGRDAEMRDAGKDRVCSFSIASNEKVKGEDVTTWVDCALWGKRGESLVTYLTKGSKLTVVGSLSQRFSEKTQKTYLQLRVSEIALQGGGAGREPAQRAQTSTKPAPSQPTDDYGSASGADDDLPF